MAGRAWVDAPRRSIWYPAGISADARPDRGADADPSTQEPFAMTRPASLVMALAALLALTAARAPADEPAASKLEITAATWGVFTDGKPVEGKSVDVTGAVARGVKEGRLRMEVETGPFGDPASGKGKALEVKYTLGGKPGSVRVNEGDTLLVPPPVLAGKLAITRATYGDQSLGRTSDVTAQLQQRLRDGKLEVPVDNNLCGDPAEGVLKQLRVEYTIGDVALVKRAYEGNTLSIVEPGAETKGK